MHQTLRNISSQGSRHGARICNLGHTHMFPTSRVGFDSIQRKPRSAEPALYALRLDAENLEVIVLHMGPILTLLSVTCTGCETRGHN